MKHLFYYLLIGLVMGFTACGDGGDEPEPAKGKVKFVFDHRIDGDPIRFDTMIYVNEAGNPYLVNEIQYFVSDFKLWSGGESIILDQWEDIHYVDTDLPETWNYFPADDVPLGDYDSISFIFGITEEKNQSFMFVNPPESYMFWPEYLGGGYHYLKLNGKWKTPGDTVRPFNFHLGIGQIYDEQGNIVGFVQNYFTVHLSHTAFKLTAEKAAMIQITMNVEQWFKDPHTWDFNYWGGDIMENQAAMQTAKENGHNVFTAKVLLEE